MANYLASSCTYTYSASWNAVSYCGWGVNGSIASASSDPGGACAGSYTCNSINVGSICGASSSTPRRTTGLTNAVGYHIVHKWITARSCYYADGTCAYYGYLNWGGATITNNSTNTTLSLSCASYDFTTTTWTAPLNISTMLTCNCYRSIIKCTHNYLNDAKFSGAGSTNSFWTQTCQPCY